MLKYFSENTKLAEAITVHPALIQLLPRFNISLGFGDKTIGGVCKEFAVPVNLFLVVCNIYAFESYRPTLSDISGTDTDGLIAYLKKSHAYYFDKRIPHIEKHLKIITEQIDRKQGAILMSFFLQYKKEVKEHFDYEEDTVFPMLKSLQENKYHDVGFIGYEEAHVNIEDTLDDLIQIVFKYLPGNVEYENSIGMAFDILQLAEDLKKHALIEERILMPFIEYMERRNEI